MAPAARKLAARLETVTIAPLAFPVLANVDARPNQEARRVKELLVLQVDHPVRWEETVRAMAESGVTHILEIGPGKVLAGLVRRIAKGIEVLPVGTVDGIEAACEAARILRLSPSATSIDREGYGLGRFAASGAPHLC